MFTHLRISQAEYRLSISQTISQYDRHSIDKLKNKIAEIIKPAQCAYRPNVTTTDALLQYIDDYTTFLDKQKVKFVQSACLDFSKAFDGLQPSIVREKWNFTALIPASLNWYPASFVTGQCVKFPAKFSSTKHVKGGSPWGTKLGPILWLIYVNDLEIDGFC